MRTWLILGACIALVAFIDAFERAVRTEVTLTLLYLAPVALASWFGSRSIGIAVALCAAATCFVEAFSAADLPSWHYWDAALRTGVLVTFALLLSTLRTRKRWLREAVLTRTRELRREVKERRRVEVEASKALEAQKNAIADQLHDGLAQSLSALAVKCRCLEEELRQSGSSSATLAAEIGHSLNSAVDQSRQVARGLSTMEIDANEVVGALARLVAESQSLHGITCSFTSNTPALVVGGDLGLQFYLIVQQAIDNAIRHGAARQIQVHLIREAPDLHLSIADDGQGFDPTLPAHQGLGLRLMRFRAHLLGGQLTVQSELGKGTTLRVCTSLESAGIQDQVQAPSPSSSPETQSKI